MANEFVAKNGLISQNNTTVSGSLTVTQGITGSLYGTSSWAVSASWAPGNAAGSDSTIQYNDNGLLAGAGNFRINKTSEGIELGSSLVQANGAYSFAMGNIATAAGQSAIAQGDTLGGANGDYSFARGRATTAQGNYSYAAGDDSVAIGEFSYAQGLSVVASGSHQFVIGQQNLLNNNTSLFVIGNGVGTGVRSDVMRVNLTEVEITGSLIVSGTTTLYGDLLPGGPYTNNTSSYDIGSPTAAWKDIYVSNGSIYFISGSSSGSLSFQVGTGIALTGSLNGTASYALTASYAMNGGGSTNTGSLLTTASVSSNTITFTKGDGSTFPITVATGSGTSSPAFPYTGSAIITGSLTITGSLNVTQGITGSLQGTSSYTNDFDDLDYLLVYSFRTTYNY